MLKKVIILSIFVVPLFGYVAFEGFYKDYSKNREKIYQIADMIGANPDDVSIECESGRLDIIGTGKDREIKFYLGPQDKEKRCEIAVSSLDPFPATYDISFDIKQNIENPSDIWRILFQIHEYKDFGESWRCPPISVEAYEAKFRVFNRWDKEKITITDEKGCISENGSIKSRDIGLGVLIDYNNWQKFSLTMNASPFDDGLLNASIDKTVSGELKGGNVYNDKRAPFAKLGIYSPSGWTPDEIKSGKSIEVSFKNINLKSSLHKK